MHFPRYNFLGSKLDYAYAEYEVMKVAEFNAGMVTPYVSYSMFDLEQDVVSPAPQPYVNSAIGTWDDNAKNWAVGAFYNRIGDAFRPYLNISSTSGKFTSPKKGKSTELSEMVTTVGITGSW